MEIDGSWYRIFIGHDTTENIWQHQGIDECCTCIGVVHRLTTESSPIDLDAILKQERMAYRPDSILGCDYKYLHV